MDASRRLLVPTSAAYRRLTAGATASSLNIVFSFRCRGMIGASSPPSLLAGVAICRRTVVSNDGMPCLTRINVAFYSILRRVAMMHRSQLGIAQVIQEFRRPGPRILQAGLWHPVPDKTRPLQAAVCEV